MSSKEPFYGFVVLFCFLWIMTVLYFFLVKLFFNIRILIRAAFRAILYIYCVPSVLATTLLTVLCDYETSLDFPSE